MPRNAAVRIRSIENVRTYQTHFNAAYGDLKTKVTALQSAVTTGAAANIVDAFGQSVGVAAAQASAWAEHAPTQAISFDGDSARVALAAFREFVADLARRKNAMPAEPLGTAEEKAKVVALWEQVQIPVRSTNAAIKVTEGLISGYKAQLSSDSVPQLQQHIPQLQATKRRYELA